MSADERAAFDRLKHPNDKRDYLAAHVALRLVLARAANVPPSQLPLVRDGLGRPSLVGIPAHFSLTHCAGLVACAVSVAPDAEPVGIDAEPLSAAARVDEIKALVMTGEEQNWAEHIEPERGARLVALWTAKEAVLKVRGIGLSGPGGIDEMRRVVCQPLSWVGAVGRFRSGAESVTTQSVLDSYCLALARTAPQETGDVVPELLTFPFDLGVD